MCLMTFRVYPIKLDGFSLGIWILLCDKDQKNKKRPVKFTGRFFNHTMNLVISNHAHNQFITCVFANVDDAIVEQQILTFDALQGAAYGWGFVQIV